jgi:bifunctional DNase/RNase
MSDAEVSALVDEAAPEQGATAPEPSTDHTAGEEAADATLTHPADGVRTGGTEVDDDPKPDPDADDEDGGSGQAHEDDDAGGSDAGGEDDSEAADEDGGDEAADEDGGDEAADEDEDSEAAAEDEDDEAAGEDEDESEDADAEPIGFEFPRAMSRMLFVDIVLVLPSTHPVVVLQEADMPYRELRIPIGGPEGIAIGYAARQVETPRPLTHELMTQLLERFNLCLDVVQITGLTGGTFTAELLVSGPAGQRTLDCRPSDAIALALRQRIAVPIMVDADVLDRAAAAAAGSN